jgi:hypothetical protein
VRGNPEFKKWPSSGSSEAGKGVGRILGRSRVQKVAEFRVWDLNISDRTVGPAYPRSVRCQTSLPTGLRMMQGVSS